MAKKEKKVKEERLEDILWACREHLRGMADMSDKRDVLLTLVFLKFMSDCFVEQQEKIRAKYADPKLAEIQMKKPAAYGQDGVIFLPEECRWRYLVDQVEANNYSLVPSRYIEFVDRDTELDYDTALKEVGTKAAVTSRRRRARPNGARAQFMRFRSGFKLNCRG